MADDIEQKIILDFETNAEKTAKEVNTLDDAIEDVNESQKKSVKQQKKVKKTTDKTTKSVKKQKQGLEGLGGGIGKAIKGFKGLIKQMWLVVANPVGLILIAIVGALAALFKAFTSTKAGAEKFEQIMDGISATIDVVRDRILNVGRAIAKFFSGDFKGAFSEARAAVSGFGAEVAKEFKIAADARKSLQQVADAMRDLGVSRAKLNRDLIEAKEIIESETASYEEKNIAIQKVRKAEAEQTEQELTNARKKLKAIQAQNAQSDSSSDALQAEADARIALFNLEEKSARNRVKFILLQEKADIDEAARLKLISDARKLDAKIIEDAALKEKKRLDDLLSLKIKSEEDARKAIEDIEDKTEEEKLARRKERALLEIEELKKKGIDVEEILKLNNEKFNLLEDELREKRRLEKEEQDKKDDEKKIEADKEQAKKELEIEEAKLAQKKAIQDATFGLLFQGLGALKSLFGQNKKIQKAILIAESAVALSKLTMNTIEAVAKDNATSPITLGQPWAGIHIAQGVLGAANIIASTAQGLKAVGGGSAGSAPNLGGLQGSATNAAPSVGFQSSSENQISTSLADNINDLPPVEAFVVEQAVTTAQALARNKIESNSI